jgi:Rieske Fe-S protein
MLNAKKILFIGLLFCFISNGCDKNNQNNKSGAPSAYVDTYVYITSNPSLNVVTGWANINGGVKGILVYRKSPSEFMAYERNCTYLPANACSKISGDPGGIFAIDTCCGSKFLLNDGSVNKGPATIPLTRYQTSFDGSNTIHVFN